MIRTAADVNRMANLLAMKIEQRRSDIRKHTDYVRGKRGTLKFASDEFKRYMSDRFSGFADNWCLPVAQAPVERIHFRGFIPYGDVELDSHVMRVWERNDCDRKLQETALMMTTTGRAFGLVTSMPATSDGRQLGKLTLMKVPWAIPCSVSFLRISGPRASAVSKGMRPTKSS